MECFEFFISPTPECMLPGLIPYWFIHFYGRFSSHNRGPVTIAFPFGPWNESEHRRNKLIKNRRPDLYCYSHYFWNFMVNYEQNKGGLCGPCDISRFGCIKDHGDKRG